MKPNQLIEVTKEFKMAAGGALFVFLGGVFGAGQDLNNTDRIMERKIEVHDVMMKQNAETFKEVARAIEKQSVKLEEIRESMARIETKLDQKADKYKNE